MQTPWGASPATSFEANNPTNKLCNLASPRGKKTKEWQDGMSTAAASPAAGEGGGSGSSLPAPWDGGEGLRRGLEEERQRRLKFGPDLAPRGRAELKKGMGEMQGLDIRRPGRRLWLSSKEGLKEPNMCGLAGRRLRGHDNSLQVFGGRKHQGGREIIYGYTLGITKSNGTRLSKEGFRLSIRKHFPMMKRVGLQNNPPRAATRAQQFGGLRLPMTKPWAMCCQA